MNNTVETLRLGALTIYPYGLYVAGGAALATAAAGVLVRSPAKSYFSICRD